MSERIRYRIVLWGLTPKESDPSPEPVPGRGLTELGTSQLPAVEYRGEHSVGGLFDRLAPRQRDPDGSHSIEGVALGEETGGLFDGRKERSVGFPRQALANPLERHVEEERGTEPGDRAPVRLSHVRASPGRDDRVGKRFRPSEESRLALAKRALALRLEERADGEPGRSLDFEVEVDEREVEALRHPSADRGLAAPHEPDEVDAARPGAPPSPIEEAARVLFEPASGRQGADHGGGVRPRVEHGVEPLLRLAADRDERLRLVTRGRREDFEPPRGAAGFRAARKNRAERDVVGARIG